MKRNNQRAGIGATDQGEVQPQPTTDQDSNQVGTAPASTITGVPQQQAAALGTSVNENDSIRTAKRKTQVNVSAEANIVRFTSVLCRNKANRMTSELSLNIHFYPVSSAFVTQTVSPVTHTLAV
jgi:hypothetical protein